MNKWTYNKIYVGFGDENLECIGNFDCEIETCQNRQPYRDREDSWCKPQEPEKWLTITGEVISLVDLVYTRVVHANAVAEILHPLLGCPELITIERNEFKATGYLMEFVQEEKDFNHLNNPFASAPVYLRTEIRTGFRARFKLSTLELKPNQVTA
jgi:hypothetical protein